MKASILIPVYNEKNTLEKVIKRTLEQEIALMEASHVISISSQPKYFKEIFQNSENLEIKTSLHDEMMTDIDSIFYDCSSKNANYQLIKQSFQILSDQGNFILIVPNQKTDDLIDYLKECHFKIKQTQPFNKTTKIFSSLISQQDTGHYQQWQLKILNTVLPICRYIDHLLPTQAGSLLIVATK